MTHISEGINTGEISNNDLFARKLSGRIDLDLFCIAISVKSFAFNHKITHRKQLRLDSKTQGWQVLKYLD